MGSSVDRGKYTTHTPRPPISTHKAILPETVMGSVAGADEWSNGVAGKELDTSGGGSSDNSSNSGNGGSGSGDLAFTFHPCHQRWGGILLARGRRSGCNLPLPSMAAVEPM